MIDAEETSGRSRTKASTAEEAAVEQKENEDAAVPTFGTAKAARMASARKATGARRRWGRWGAASLEKDELPPRGAARRLGSTEDYQRGGRFYEHGLGDVRREVVVRRDRSFAERSFGSYPEAWTPHSATVPFDRCLANMPARNQGSCGSCYVWRSRAFEPTPNREQGEGGEPNSRR